MYLLLRYVFIQVGIVSIYLTKFNFQNLFSEIQIGSWENNNPIISVLHSNWIPMFREHIFTSFQYLSGNGVCLISTFQLFLYWPIYFPQYVLILLWFNGVHLCQTFIKKCILIYLRHTVFAGTQVYIIYILHYNRFFITYFMCDKMNVRLFNKAYLRIERVNITDSTVVNYIMKKSYGGY